MNKQNTQTNKGLLNATLIISAVVVSIFSLGFAMFGQFDAMLIGLGIAFTTSLFIK